MVIMKVRLFMRGGVIIKGLSMVALTVVDAAASST
jgi:hypothetical protein